MSILEVREISKYFGGLKALDEVSFSMPEGIIKAVIGPNGAGKTTLFNIITGTFPATSGSIHFQNQDITGSKPHHIAAKGIMRTFQNLKLASHMSVLDNVKLGLHTQSSSGFFSSMLHLPRSVREEQALEEAARTILELLDLRSYADSQVGNLSFGKQRAVELGRALAAEPHIILLDEPASGLNIQETEELSELIVSIRDRGITILLVEHDMELVMDISDEVVVLNFGQKIAEGTPQEIQQNDDVIAIYLGEAYA